MAKHTKRDRAPALVLAAGLAAIGLFCLMLRAELRLPRTISTEGLEILPAGSYACAFYPAEDARNGDIALTGWAVPEGERYEQVRQWVAVYDSQTGRYTRLSTVMVENYEPMETLDDPQNALFGGFYALVPEKLAAAADSLELCILDRSNLRRNLVHTGVMLSEVLE